MTTEEERRPSQLPVALTPPEALSLIQRFLSSWRSITVDDVKVSRIQSGYNNSVYVVSKEGNDVQNPAKLVIRMYGGNVMSDKSYLRPLDHNHESIVVCHLGKVGLGPRIFGLFDGGRLEEFIDCRLVTLDDLRSPTVQRDLARNIAYYHTVKVPLPKPNYLFIDVLRDSLSHAKEAIEILRSRQEYQSIRTFLFHDFEREFSWLEPLINPSRHRIVFMHWDAHPANMAIRTRQPENVSLPFQTFLFDYELSGYNMRGKDTGLMLACLILGQLGDSNGLVDDTHFPTDEESHLFIDEYRKECSKLFDDWDPDGVDSVDHIMMESMLGNMITMLCFLFAITPSYVIWEGQNDRNKLHFLINCLRRMWESYCNTKDSLLSRYPDVSERL